MLRLDLWFLMLVPAEQDWGAVNYLPSFGGYLCRPPFLISEVIENNTFVEGDSIM